MRIATFYNVAFHIHSAVFLLISLQHYSLMVARFLLQWTVSYCVWNNGYPVLIPYWPSIDPWPCTDPALTPNPVLTQQWPLILYWPSSEMTSSMLTVFLSIRSLILWSRAQKGNSGSLSLTTEKKNKSFGWDIITAAIQKQNTSSACLWPLAIFKRQITHTRCTTHWSVSGYRTEMAAMVSQAYCGHRTTSNTKNAVKKNK